MPDVNVPLLSKVLDHITAHPEEWRQDWWAQRTGPECGTAYCVAGHALVMSGHDFVWFSEDNDEDERSSFVAYGKCERHAESAAAELLGLDRDARGEVPLFAPRNTLRDVYSEAHRLTGGEISIPDELPDGS